MVEVARQLEGFHRSRVSAKQGALPVSRGPSSTRLSFQVTKQYSIQNISACLLSRLTEKMSI